MQLGDRENDIAVGVSWPSAQRQSSEGDSPATEDYESGAAALWVVGSTFYSKARSLARSRLVFPLGFPGVGGVVIPRTPFRGQPCGLVVGRAVRASNLTGFVRPAGPVAIYPGD